MTLLRYNAPEAQPSNPFMYAAIQCDEVDEFARGLPTVFEAQAPEIQAMTFFAIFAGMSKERGRIVAYHISNEDRWRPQPILRGHFGSPDANAKFAGYYDSVATAGPAERGEDVERFHAAMGRHLAAVDRGGGYGPDRKIGGWLHTGRIDANGIVIKDVCDLDKRFHQETLGEAAA